MCQTDFDPKEKISWIKFYLLKLRDTQGSCHIKFEDTRHKNRKSKIHTPFNAGCKQRKSKLILAQTSEKLMQPQGQKQKPIAAKKVTSNSSEIHVNNSPANQMKPEYDPTADHNSNSKSRTSI